MTKEEYEKLLKSDYWKGYSYSLIKERNFTCEDCGRRFPNERNKLQVHHLVYRDTNPWSYKPEELIVLCEDCHKRRHGMVLEQNDIFEPGDNSQSGREWVIKPERKFKKKYLVYILLILFLVWIGVGSNNKNETSGKNDNVQFVDKELVNDDVVNSITSSSSGSSTRKDNKQVKQKKWNANNASEDDNSYYEPIEYSEEYQENNATQSSYASGHKSISENLEESTHASVVKQAKQAGVSSEGSTSEILDRITHASVVKQAKQAGVSSEGSTSEILDRITHASVVKQAKQIGVSTEGSTSEILDRITRKQMEKYNQ